MIGAAVLLALAVGLRAAPSPDKMAAPLSHFKSRDMVPLQDDSDDDEVEWLPLGRADLSEVMKKKGADATARETTFNLANNGVWEDIPFPDNSFDTYIYNTNIAGTFMEFECTYNLWRRDYVSELNVGGNWLMTRRKDRLRTTQLSGTVSSVTVFWSLDVSESESLFDYTPSMSCRVRATGGDAPPSTDAPTDAPTAEPTQAPPTSCDYCRSSGSSRIVNGQSISVEDRPFYLSLFSGSSFICGASLISAEWALTAAHCVDGGGTYRLGFESSDQALPSNNQRVAQVVIHPSYRSTDFPFDIALLRLSTPVSFSDRVRPACLNSMTNNELDNKALQVIGLGGIDDNRPERTDPDSVLAGFMEAMTDNECRNERMWASDHFICVKPIAPEDTHVCYGDSGGPLIDDRAGYKFLVGATSYGPGQCISQRPGAYTEVEQFLPWIQQVSGVTACSL